MKTQYYTATSLDGYIADEEHSIEWLFQFDPIEDTGYPAFFAQVGALAMGSNTYGWVMQHLPAWPYKLPTWVFSSRQLDRPAGAELHFVQGDVRPVHRQMASSAGDKNVWVVGGGELVGQFYDAGLLDEIIVQIAAVTLGRGAPLLPRRITNPPLQLTSVQAVGQSFAELRYNVPKATGK